MNCVLTAFENLQLKGEYSRASLEKIWKKR